MTGSLILFTATATASAAAPSVAWLIAARVVQGVGEACGPLIQAIIRDVIDDEKLRMRVTAIIGTLKPLAIISAPSIGGLIAFASGTWRSVFHLLIAKPDYKISIYIYIYIKVAFFLIDVYMICII